MTTLKHKIVLAIIALTVFNLNAQDIHYVRKQLERLCSPEFFGRAYYQNGDSIAADYIAGQFDGFRLKSYTSNYFQEYSFNVNSLEEATIQINGDSLEFGVDFMMNPSSGSLSGSFEPIMINAALMQSPSRLLQRFSEAEDDHVVILDSTGLNNPGLYKFVKTMAMTGQMGIIGMMEVFPDTPIGRVGRHEYSGPYVQISRKALPEVINNVQFEVKNRYYENYLTRNVIGYIPGQSEKVIVFTAHYDMLGSFGAGNYFPGASDNGSGTSMVLDLAKHFSSGKKPYYSVAFMLFSGEEAGLMGSTHYVNHPLFPLEKIKLVINLDMVGTGQQGVILFNAPQRPLEAAIVQKINEEKHYMKDVEERTGTANSDHWPFNEKGIPAIFFLTKGRSGGGHNIFDTPDKLPLYGYENLFKLVIDLTKELQKQETDH
jgi:aminopeptidase YwaD